MRITAQSPDNRSQRAQSDCGRKEKVGYAEEDLAEVRKCNIPRVMLHVRVGYKGNNRMENGSRRQHAETARIQRHQRLQRQHDVAVDEEHCVDNQQCTSVPLPVLWTAIQALLEP